ncbi:hypothetical protein GCM10011519_31340 [Marmoricola endophyticus]|uniref:Class E sortase n=1 Tax=Marmoricola endophyticus TaxID=2040280 RepID=A0A917F681_9ACTN|nr:sortase [Marmoricola endophyticus]GGF55190.1 hypothetical protein GCM10011519_31340 [Marmoricola endophyticus]
MSDVSTLDRDPGEREKRPRGVVFWCGVLLIVVGLGLLGYVGWQMFGTNVVSRHEAGQIRERTERAWERGEEGPSRALLHVPRFGASYSVPIVQGFTDDNLAKGVARYTDGAKAGGLGNYVLAGHRVTHGEPFSKFPDLRKGDLVEVETRTATYTYRLRNSGTDTIVDFTTAWPLWPVPSPSAKGAAPTQHLITLLTCSELFHTDDRSVVVGDLVKTRKVDR